MLAAARAVSRQHTVEKGKDPHARILHVERVESTRAPSRRFVRIQLAIPRPDGTEIVAVAGAAWSDRLPEPGWTVPVYYGERLATTTMVEIMGPPSRKA